MVPDRKGPTTGYAAHSSPFSASLKFLKNTPAGRFLEDFDAEKCPNWVDYRPLWGSISAYSD